MNYLINIIFFVLALTLCSVVDARLGRHHRKLQVVAANNKAVAGRYIVYMNDDVVNAQGVLSSTLQSFNSARVRHSFGRLFNGLILEDVPEELLELILDNPAVREVYEVRSHLLL